MRALFAKGRSRFLVTVLSVIGLLAVVRLVEYAVVAYDERNWERVQEGKGHEIIAAAEREFAGMQRVTRRIATEVGQHPAIRDVLAGRSGDRVALFAQLSKFSRDQNVGIEVYDLNESLVGWEGRSGLVHRRDVRIALDGQLISYVTRTPMASQLFVATPVRENARILGAVLVRRTIDFTYPLASTYVRRDGLTEQLRRSLGVDVEFNFSDRAEPRRDGRYLSAPLYGIDSSVVGMISVMRPSRSATIDGVIVGFRNTESILGALLVVFLAVWGTRRAVSLPSFVARVVGATATIWIARYALLWIGIPSAVISDGVFDPAFFASKFGGGLARSIGEMSITITALCVNLAVIIRTPRRGPHEPPRPIKPKGVVPVSAVFVATAGLLFWVLRGFAATVSSAVSDSTIRYGDPRIVLTSVEHLVMVMNLLVFGVALLVAAMSASLFLHRLLPPVAVQGRSDRRWLLVTGVYLAAAVLFGAIQETPLMTTSYRIVFGLFVTGVSVLLERRRDQALPLYPLALMLVLSSALLYPLLDGFVREKDRRRVETFAEDAVRPVDSWLTFVAEDGLGQLASPESGAVLASGDSDEIDQLAFTQWTRSAACRGGYSSVFDVTDALGRPVSRFIIGNHTLLAPQADAVPASVRARTVRVTAVGSGINAVKFYAGATPILSPEGTLMGYGRVVVSAGRQALFMGENPAVLRSASQESIESFYRPVTMSEFRDGVLYASNNDALPIGYSLPPAVQEAIAGGGRASLWASEVVDDKSYETFFIRNTVDGGIIALGVRELGWAWHAINIVKLLLVAVIMAAAVAVFLLVRRRLRGEKIVFTFRNRLLLALVVTAIVPVILVILYGRYAGRARLMENTARQLDEETAVVAASLPTGDLRMTQSIAEQIAADVGTDFNVYVGNELAASSRPELYEAGILDRRLSGGAYAAIMLRGKRYAVETENFVDREYAVGYRPVIDSTGVIEGVVSVPTLYRQREVEEEGTRRNAFLFTVYAAVLIFIIVIAASFANRMAAPIHVLTEATRRVARGALDVDVHVPRADGEIGELVRSFGAMTRDLKRSREELVRYERELAWKEMARQVAHEIKNPLTPMKLAIQHLRQTYRDRVTDFDRVLDEVTRTVVEQIDTLSRIASEFSHFGRMPERQWERCDVNALLSDAAQLFSGNPGITFSMNTGPSLPPVRGDREELRRAFINIIRNGIQAMEKGGTLTISTRSSIPGVEVRIQDTGHGIPAEVRARLFQPNFSTRTEGMGLGLAIVKKTLDDLGGTIVVDSVEGRGTSVTIVLPPVEDTA